MGALAISDTDNNTLAKTIISPNTSFGDIMY